MNADIQAKLDAIKAPFQSVIEATDALPALVDSYAKEVGDARYLEGQNSIAIPSPTLPDGTVDPTLKYSQDEVDKMAAADKAEFDAALAAKQAELDAAVAALAGKDQEKADAIAALRADVAAKIQMYESNEDQSVKDLIASF